MNNVISLSSSPAVAGAREPASFGRSSSPDFPTLEELVSQENPVARPARSHASDARLKSVEGGLRGGKEVGRNAVSVEETPELEEAADASLVEIPAADVAAGPQPPKATKSRKAPAGGRTSRAKSKGTASKRALPENVPPHENAEDTTASKPPKPRRKQTGAVSRHFKPQSEPAPPKPAEGPDEPLNIETALGRRVDWTPPPKDTIKEFGSRSSDIIELLSSTSKAEGAGGSKEIFQSLKETYGYELEDEPFAGTERQNTEALFKKRKLIEMVATSNGAGAMAPPPLPENSPTKQKAPKKKARTITGLATAAYEQAEPELPPPGPAEPSAPKPAGGVAPGKPKAKTKRKPKASKKKEEPHMVLYSPEAALRQVAQQDFVFGTSSQLAREQDLDPGGLPKLNDSMPVIEEEYVTPINSDAIEPEVQPKLWTAAARDAHGELLHLEVIDLAKDSSPRQEAASEGSDPFGYVNHERASQLPSTKGSGAGAGASSSAPRSIEQAIPRPSLKALSQGFSNRQLDSSSGVVPDPIFGVMSSTSPPPSSQKRLSSLYEIGSLPTQSTLQPSPSPTKSRYTVPEKPKFDLYTDAQLARQVAAYGFKPIKKRAGMISLLDECWTSKYQRQGARAYSTASPAVAEAPGEAEAAPEVAAAEPVKRPRGRPRKNSTVTSPKRLSPKPAASTSAPEKRPRGRPRKTATAPAAAKKSPAKPAKPAPSTPKKTPVLEIPDSDTSPSTASPVFSSPPTHDVSLDDSLALAPTTTEESTLQDAITKAVTSAPRSEDPTEPSWHERMLMYESVIVEDLAAWLNTGALDGVGYDGEVSAYEVKGWCEARSVCCVWRTRMGGEERKRL